MGQQETPLENISWDGVPSVGENLFEAEEQEGSFEDEVRIDGPVDETKKAFTKILEFITNTFYRTEDNNDISIELISKSKADNYYDGQRIVLSEGLVDAFGDLNLPRFIVYYHELGHHLYSQGLFKLLEKWQKQNQGPIAWDPKYHHLLNWIEDYYIEEKIVNEHPYLTDVLSCIKKLPPDYDINRIEYAFNFWYIHQAPTPALQYVDQVAFKAYVTKLLHLRDNSRTRFGYGLLSTLSIKQTKDTKYALLIIEFYNWCVSKGIFPKDQPLPSLQNPNNHLEQPGGSGGNGQDPSQAPGGNGQGNQQGNDQGQDAGKGGTSSDHSRQVGKNNKGYTEVYHIKSPTTVFKDELVSEKRLIEKELLDMSQRIQADEASLDGLFNTKHKDSAIIQPKVIVPNFFNPHRLMDQVLFKQKEHAYMNVAIFRDVSGSTSGEVHRLMHYVCEQLYKDIPVDITYYLYSSGKTSIVEVPYVPWSDSNSDPKEYKSNPLYQQLGGGTNSDAIADVITQQLSEKWLNIIITDGDLHALMRRDNIMALLKNVFVVSVNAEVEPGLLGISVQNKNDIAKINPVLSGINLDR